MEFNITTISAFGGVLATNKTIDLAAAEEINKLFFEILIAPDFVPAVNAVMMMMTKKKTMKRKRKKRKRKSPKVHDPGVC